MSEAKAPLLHRAIASLRRSAPVRGRARSDSDVLSILSVDGVGIEREDGPCVAGLAGELVTALQRRGLVLTALGPPPPDPLDDEETEVYARTLRAHEPLLDRVLGGQSDSAPGQSTIEGINEHPEHSTLFFSALLHLALVIGAPLPPAVVNESSIAQQLALRAARHDATIALIKLAVSTLDWHVAIGQRIGEGGIEGIDHVDPVVELLVRSCAYGYGDLRVRRASASAQT